MRSWGKSFKGKRGARGKERGGGPEYRRERHASAILMHYKREGGCDVV